MTKRSEWKIRALLRTMTGVGVASFAATLAQAQEAAAVPPQPETEKVKPVETKDGEEVVKLEKFVVTGSYIPYAADAPAVPVAVYNTTQIENTGVSGDLLEVIRAAAPQFVGNGNIGSSNSNIAGGSTNGGSQVKLRNVQTLVLINGRRAAFAPVSATGGYNFVDVNSIPVSAVERIEVVSDGASALYGSDAVSGVVNIILKKDFQGIEVGGGYRVADRTGHWEERKVNFITGAKSADTSITVSAEWLKSDPLFQSERPFSADQTGKTSNVPGGATLYQGVFDTSGNLIGLKSLGNYVNVDPSKLPAMGTHVSLADLVASGAYKKVSSLGSLLNLAPYVTLAMGNEKTALTTEIEHKINKSVTAFGDILYSKTKTFYQIAAQPIAGGPLTSDNVDYDATMYIFGVGVMNNTAPANPFGSPVTYVFPRNRFVDHPRQYFSETHTLRTLGGLRGEINEYYNWEVAANLNRVDQDYINRNVINRQALGDAIDSGTINLFAVKQDPVKLEQAGIFGTAYSKNESTLNSFDARLNGEIPEILPAGSIKFAIGAETRRETLSARPDAGSFTNNDINSFYNGQPMGWDGATTTDEFDADRTVDSVYAEVRVPITGTKQAIPFAHTIELDAAARYERYSDTTDPLVPKVTLRYLPLDDQFAIRGTFSKSFTAPDLYSLFGPSGVGYTNTITGFVRADGGILDDTQAVQRSATNPKLDPEKATNYSAGVVFSPRRIKGLTIEANFFRIEQTSIVGATSAESILQDVELKGTASKYIDRVRIGGFSGTPITKVGQISEAYDNVGGSLSSVYVTTFSENMVDALQQGVDLSTRYVFKVESFGKFDLALTGLWYNKMRVEDTDYVGTTNGRSVLNGGTVPRWRGNFVGSFERNQWSVGFMVDYIPHVTDTQAAITETDPQADQYIEAFTRVNLFARYSFRGGKGLLKYLDGLTVRGGVGNLFDRMPPYAKASWTDANVDAATYGSLGRVYYVEASYKF